MTNFGVIAIGILIGIILISKEKEKKNKELENEIFMRYEFHVEELLKKG